MSDPKENSGIIRARENLFKALDHAIISESGNQYERNYVKIRCLTGDYAHSLVEAINQYIQQKALQDIRTINEQINSGELSQELGEQKIMGLWDFLEAVGYPNIPAIYKWKKFYDKHREQRT